FPLDILFVVEDVAIVSFIFSFRPAYLRLSFCRLLPFPFLMLSDKFLLAIFILLDVSFVESIFLFLSIDFALFCDIILGHGIHILMVVYSQSFVCEPKDLPVFCKVGSLSLR